MKEYRVRFWHPDEDGREEFLELETMEQAQGFYDSREGKAEIQKYVDRLHAYETIVAPTYEF